MVFDGIQEILFENKDKIPDNVYIQLQNELKKSYETKKDVPDNLELQKEICEYAATSGKLSLLKWAIEHECPCDMSECKRIADECGHLDVLTYLYEIDCTE